MCSVNGCSELVGAKPDAKKQHYVEKHDFPRCGVCSKVFKHTGYWLLHKNICRVQPVACGINHCGTLINNGEEETHYRYVHGWPTCTRCGVAIQSFHNFCSHINTCRVQPVACGINHCGTLINNGEEETHYRYVHGWPTCDCGVTIPRRGNFVSHVNRCRSKKRTCLICNTMMLQHQLEPHLREEHGYPRCAFPACLTPAFTNLHNHELHVVACAAEVPEQCPYIVRECVFVGRPDEVVEHLTREHCGHFPSLVPDTGASYAPSDELLQAAFTCSGCAAEPFGSLKLFSKHLRQCFTVPSARKRKSYGCDPCCCLPRGSLLMGGVHLCPDVPVRRPRPLCDFDECIELASTGLTTCSAHKQRRCCDVEHCLHPAAVHGTKCSFHNTRCPNCISWVDSRVGSWKYDGYCATCFKRVFPDDPRSGRIYCHTKEIAVRNMINDHFPGFTHDQVLYTGNCDCTHRRRIDHRKLIGGTMLAVETDEFGHRGYDATDEELRYDDLFMVFSGKWVWIRFNPDGGSVDFEDKLEVLRNTLAEKIALIERQENTELVLIEKLFYA
jgi:hypothetical protein